MIYIGRDDEHLQLEAMEWVPAHHPMPGDVRVQVTLRLQDFCGSYSGVWLSKPELERFLKELESLEDSRKATARLDAVSPNEFSLELRPYGHLGHFEASVLLGRHQFSGPSCWPTTLCGGFEVDPAGLPSILSGFRALLVPRATS